MFLQILCFRLSESKKVAAYLNKISIISSVSIFFSMAFAALLVKFSEKFTLGHTFCLLYHSASIILYNV